MHGDGRIYQRGETFFIAYSINGREFRESTRSPNWEDAQRLLEQRLKEREAVVQAVARAPAGLGFAEMASAYLAEYELREHRTLPTARGRVEHLRAFFGGMPAPGMTAGVIAKYQAAGASAATVNRETAGLHRMMIIAVRGGLLATVPLFPPRLRENPPRQGFFEYAEYRAVRAHLPAPYKDILDFAYYTGWRRREITELNWAEVDWNGGVVRLDPRRSKNGSGRLLPITPLLRTVLKRRQRHQRSDIPFVFHRDGITVRTWKTCWAKACAAAHLKGRYLHDCRRTAARNLVRAGVTERIAMALLGHKTRCMFDRYNIVSEHDLRQAGNQLSTYLQHQAR